MSRAVPSPQTRTPASTPAKAPTPASTGQIPHEKIAQRAYEKWMKRGCPHGSDVQDWVDAEAELRSEAGHSVKQGMSTTRH